MMALLCRHQARGTSGKSAGAPLAAAGLAALVTACSALAARPLQPLPPPKYSFDVLSPSIGGAIQAASVLDLGPLDAPGPVPDPLFTGELLGFPAAQDDLDAMSFSYSGLPQAQTFTLLFSVDRETLGAAPPAPELIALMVPYNAQDQAVMRRHAAGDQYMSLRLFTRCGIVEPSKPGAALDNNVLVRNNWDEGGTDFKALPATSAWQVVPPQTPQDNVDGTAAVTAVNDCGPLVGPLYFSASSSSPSLPMTASGADIFVKFPGQTSTVFLAAEDLGLTAADDIDGLIVFDENVDGACDPGDQVLFTLAPGSPFLEPPLGLPLSPADVFRFICDGPDDGPLPPELYAQAADFGLLDADNVDSLELLCCVEPVECARVHGIRRVPGDFDDDGDMDLRDVAAYSNCVSAACPAIMCDAPTPECLVAFDANRDGLVTLADYAGLYTGLTGP